VNVLTVTGRLVADPARRTTTNGIVCEFRLAINGRPRLWLNVETWGQLAGRCAQHLQTGRHVAASGTLCCDEYVTRAGDKASRWFLRAVTLTYLDRPAACDSPDVDEAVV
jgi:single-stranded DNA-binding protein